MRPLIPILLLHTSHIPFNSMEVPFAFPFLSFPFLPSPSITGPLGLSGHYVSTVPVVQWLARRPHELVTRGRFPAGASRLLRGVYLGPTLRVRAADLGMGFLSPK